MIEEFKKNTVTQVDSSKAFCNICSFLKRKSYVPIKEQHCKHTEEMLFLADTYNTYLGNFQMHRQIKYKKYKNTKKGNLQNKKKKKKGKNQVLRGDGVMCSKNITQLVKGACQALHTG